MKNMKNSRSESGKDSHKNDSSSKSMNQNRNDKSTSLKSSQNKKITNN